MAGRRTPKPDNFLQAQPLSPESTTMQPFRHAVLLLILTAFGLHLGSSRAAAKPIPDKNLEAAVRAALHEPKTELTDEKLGNLFVLEAAGKGIRDLTGLEKCKNLALLKLTGNEVTDLRPLEGLKNLQSLDLAKNKITDVAPLSTLPRLYYLELSENQVSDVESLGKATTLSSLYLGGNKVEDITPLASLVKLSSLSLGRNRIRDIGALAKVTRLMTLDLNANQIEDLTPLTRQTEISLLMLERNKIHDLAPLVALAKADVEGPKLGPAHLTVQTLDAQALALQAGPAPALATLLIAAKAAGSEAFAVGPKRFAPYLRLYLAGNPLSDVARSRQIPALKKFGVRVHD
jgi:hypothetical protein